MNTHIKQSDSGHFKSAQDAKNYQDAMKVKKEIEKAAGVLIRNDDKVDIDFNRPAAGDILVDRFKDNGNTYSGRVTYDTDTGALKSVDLEKEAFGMSLESNIHYSFKQSDNKKVYEIDDTSVWDGGLYTHGTTCDKQKLVVNQNGDIDYNTDRKEDIKYER